MTCALHGSGMHGNTFLIKTIGRRTTEKFKHFSWNPRIGALLAQPGVDAISIMSFAEDVCDEGGRKKFAVLEAKRGTNVADRRRFYKDLQEKPGQKTTRSHRKPSSPCTRSRVGFTRPCSACRDLGRSSEDVFQGGSWSWRWKTCTRYVNNSVSSHFFFQNVASGDRDIQTFSLLPRQCVFSHFTSQSAHSTPASGRRFAPSPG